MTAQMFIELSQSSKITHSDDNEFDGHTTETVFESVFIATSHIVKMSSAGKTRLTLTTGENILVKETPAEIIEKLYEEQIRGE